MSLPLIHIDASIIVVDKPTLLLSVPGRGPQKQDSVVTRLARDYPGVREVHRLDWETSGLMLLARTREAHSELSRQFREREVTKRYHALVYGALSAPQGEVDLPLRCDWPNRPRQMVDREQGKPSLTRWRRLALEEDCSRVELTPVTGRSHQLRVHMQALGHPILGDRLYAHRAALAMAGRLLLHAVELTIGHPDSGERLTLRSSPPF
jgi:tRNA pseudouridine32 synthase/23S rRNA pseudouridine746 synthase